MTGLRILIQTRISLNIIKNMELTLDAFAPANAASKKKLAVPNLAKSMTNRLCKNIDFEMESDFT